MGQVIKLLYLRQSVSQSVSQCVCRRSYDRNFYSILMKFCTMVRIGGDFFKRVGDDMASAEREPITGVWGRAPCQRVRG